MPGQFLNYSANNSNLVVCGVPMENLSDAGYTIEYQKPRNTGRVGVNGGGIRVPNTTKPILLTINLLPGSPEKSALLNLDKADAFDGESFHAQIGAPEAIYMYKPLLQNIGSRTRGVPDAENVTDDVITVMFLDSSEL
ncbi:hypothetical protein NVP1112O_38 [Vibrio phage 1.112.O._10N.286.46.B11]|nr:hypothetical protein NVP1112O_38 [Vibrio phage 1.112.O._10N.286.46.B11]